MIFTQEQIDEIHRRLSLLGVRDSDFPNADKLLGGEFITILQDGKNKKIRVEELLTEEYNPSFSGNIAVNNSIGSIEEGTLLSSLKGKSFSELIDMMLVKEIWNDPEYTHTINFTLPATIVEASNIVPSASVTALWNNNITVASGYEPKIEYTLTTPDSITEAGEYTYKLNYSYPNGYYTIKSNLGNEKNIIVPYNRGTVINRTLQVTYPWFINNTKQELVAVNKEYTVTKNLSGKPVIAIPGKNSEVKIQADLGFGYMDVEWSKETKLTQLDSIQAYKEYVVYTKPDNYSTTVPHRITFTIKL